MHFCLRANRVSEAARCLSRMARRRCDRGRPVITCLRRSGDTEQLARLCLRAVERKGRACTAFEELNRLRDDSLLPPHLESRILRILEELGAQGRKPFEERAEAWVARARKEVEGRYARIWALDLGTTTSAVAVYDGRTRQAVLCPWKGRQFFASTLTIDADGNETVGVTGEEALAEWVKGFIGAAKRRIGGTTRYRVRGRDYRTEEVAARLIAHARRIVEDFLADCVLQQVADWPVRMSTRSTPSGSNGLRTTRPALERPEAIVTIPAFFRNNQKQATRNAARIAGWR